MSNLVELYCHLAIFALNLGEHQKTLRNLPTIELDEDEKTYLFAKFNLLRSLTFSAKTKRSRKMLQKLSGVLAL
jgi:hypothetical protein